MHHVGAHRLVDFQLLKPRYQFSNIEGDLLTRFCTGLVRPLVIQCLMGVDGDIRVGENFRLPRPQLPAFECLLLLTGLLLGASFVLFGCKSKKLWETSLIAGVDRIQICFSRLGRLSHIFHNMFCTVVRLVCIQRFVYHVVFDLPVGVSTQNFVVCKTLRHSPNPWSLILSSIGHLRDMGLDVLKVELRKLLTFLLEAEISELEISICTTKRFSHGSVVASTPVPSIHFVVLPKIEKEFETDYDVSTPWERLR